MTGTAVAEKVRSALARELRRDPATITPDQALREDLGLNSLDAIELMFKVEEEFDLEIPDADVQKLRTVGDLVAYLESRLAGGAAPASPPGPSAVPAPAAPVVAATPELPKRPSTPARARPASRAASVRARPSAKSKKGAPPAGTRRSSKRSRT